MRQQTLSMSDIFYNFDNECTAVNSVNPFIGNNGFWGSYITDLSFLIFNY